MVPSMAFCNYEEIIVAKLGKFFCNFVRFYYAINKDIIEITGAMKNSQCQKNNPLGKCCHKIIQEAIDKGLSMK